MRPVYGIGTRDFVIMATNISKDGSHSVYLGEYVCTRGGCQIVTGYSTKVNTEKPFLLSLLHVEFGSMPLSPKTIEHLLGLVSADSLYWRCGREHVPTGEILSKGSITQDDYLRLQAKLKLYKIPRT